MDHLPRPVSASHANPVVPSPAKRSATAPQWGRSVSLLRFPQRGRRKPFWKWSYKLEVWNISLQRRKKGFFCLFCREAQRCMLWNFKFSFPFLLQQVLWQSVSCYFLQTPLLSGRFIWFSSHTFQKTRSSISPQTFNHTVSICCCFWSNIAVAFYFENLFPSISVWPSPFPHVFYVVLGKKHIKKT